MVDEADTPGTDPDSSARFVDAPAVDHGTSRAWLSPSGPRSLGATVTAGLGLLCLMVATFAAVASWGALLGSHPAYGVLLVVVWTLGLGLLVTALVMSRRGRRRSRWWLVAALPVLVVLAATMYLRPFPAADRAVGIIELSSQVGSTGIGRPEGGIRIEQTPSHLLLSPTDVPEQAGTAAGLVFYPGARVDPRAYATLLAPIAQAGHPVVVVKPPLGSALLDTDAAEGAIAAYRAWSEADVQPRQWAVGGHSLGGVAAARFARSAGADVDEDGGRSGIVGLVLWASYPTDQLEDSGLEVLSVSGTEDQLVTPVEVEASRDDLPADAEFVVIDGANHAQFGDYGRQGGDGEATIPDEQARTRIVESTIAFLDRLA